MDKKTQKGLVFLIYVAVAVFVVGLVVFPGNTVVNLATTLAEGIPIAIITTIAILIVHYYLRTGEVPEVLKSARSRRLFIAVALATGGLVAAVSSGLNWVQTKQTPTPFEVRIAEQASSKHAAEQLLDVLWNPDPKWRRPFQDGLSTEEQEELTRRVVETEPLASPELQTILNSTEALTATLLARAPALQLSAVQMDIIHRSLTPTDIVTQPVEMVRHAGTKRDYRVRTISVWNKVHLGSFQVPGFDDTLLEAYLLPARKVTDGDEYELPAQLVYIVVHRHECAECGGWMRPSYLVAGLIIR